MGNDPVEVKDWRLGAPRKIKHQLGFWYLVTPNVRYQRWFNGLPDSKVDLWIPEDNLVKHAENKVDGLEMVFEVIHTPKYDLVRAPGQDNWVQVPPIVNVGDIVIVKGHVQKLHTEPIVYACIRDQFVAMVVPASERSDYLPPEEGESLE